MRALIIATLLLSGCVAAATPLSDAEKQVALAAGVDEATASTVKARGTAIERLMSLTKDFDEAPAAGIVLSTAPKAGRTVLHALRNDLAGSAYRAYLNDDTFGHGADKVAIVKSDDLGYLAMVRTDGINHDIEHEQVLARYKEWNARYGLELVGAGQDWLEAKVVRPPSDWTAFAKEVYAFCPDVVDQGTGTVDALAKEMESGQVLYLWWD